MISNYLGKLGKFKWTIHNLVGHPLSELLFLCGQEKLSNWIHDVTIPEHRPEEGRG